MAEGEGFELEAFWRRPSRQPNGWVGFVFKIRPHPCSSVAKKIQNDTILVSKGLISTNCASSLSLRVPKRDTERIFMKIAHFFGVKTNPRPIQQPRASTTPHTPTTRKP